MHMYIPAKVNIARVILDKTAAVNAVTVFTLGECIPLLHTLYFVSWLVDVFRVIRTVMCLWISVRQNIKSRILFQYRHLF